MGKITNIAEFIKSTGGFDKRQYGFLENSNTVGLVMDVLDDISKYLDGGRYAVVVFLDLQKASATVDHGRLLSALEDVGICGKLNELLQKHLCNRKIQTP